MGEWGAAVRPGPIRPFRGVDQPGTVAFARSVQRAVASKARSHAATWQQSDQYFVNTLLDAKGVTWGRGRMAAMSDYKERMNPRAC